MKAIKRVLSISLIMIFLFQVMQSNLAFAETYGVQPAPEQVMVTPSNSTQPAIGYNKLEGSTGYYVDIGWNPAFKPPVPAPPTISQYLNIYAQEVKKPYKPGSSTPYILKEGNVSKSDTPKRLRDFASGTMYYINTRAFYTYPNPDPNSTGVFTSGESAFSNSVKVMTDIDISALPAGTNSIKIMWDDVWDVGKRIDYKLYISDNASFSNTLPIHIGQEQIGADGPVSVNESTGKLEYTYTQAEPAKVYYVKVVPDITDPDIIYTPESKSVPVSSYILVRTTKISETGSGANAQTIWQLDWTPVVTGLDNSGVSITYEIDKYVNDVPIPMLLESGTTTFITLPTGTQSTYYKIWANVLKNGVPLYPNSIKIQSDKITVKDQDVSAHPPSPEIVGEFDDSHNEPIITYSDKYVGGVLKKKGELTSNSATILWRAPKKADGTVDEDTLYDIWLINDPNLIDSPPNNNKIATSISMTDANKIMDGTNLLGYKYVVPNLTPNSTYYFKVVAKKVFIEFKDNKLTSVEYASNPALKIIITPTQGPIDQPLVPNRPPFKVKIKLDRKTAITDTQVIVQLKNKWYEHYVNGNWVAIDTLDDAIMASRDPAQNNATLGEIIDLLEQGTNVNLYRIVEYDNGVTFDVGCVPFTDGMSFSDINNKVTNKVVGFPITPNDIPDEDKTKNPDNKLHNVNIPLTGLDPNTTYIIWVRASRQSANLTSGPSDPLIVTTNPEDVVQVEKPIVPTINYSFVADTYVDLGWNMKQNYNYYIKYGTSDDIALATGTANTSTTEITNSGVSFYRIKGLNPDTLYYFWIQAEAVNGALKSKSEWSDSFPLKTKPNIPPTTPRGFGVKSPQSDNITKNTITFEWIKEEGIEYTLEVAGGVDYKDVKEYKAGNVSEFTVTGLNSNFRYFARLYAYDPIKKLKSIPTQSITVRTKRSSDDYDSDQDIENVISGDYIVKDPTVIKGEWTIKITGANADRFVEHVQNDNILDYSIDLSKPPVKAGKINVIISNKVFEALNNIGENIRVVTETTYVILRPNVLIRELVETQARKLGDFNYTLSIISPSTSVAAGADNLVFKTNATEIAINANDGSNFIPIISLNKPLKVVVPYTDSSWYKQGFTSAYVYNKDKAVWEKAPTSSKFDVDNNKGTLTFETVKTGNVAVADIGKSYYDDINGNQYEEAIISVASTHDLKSISGRKFEPDKKVLTADATKLALDILDYKYGNDFMSIAAKSRLVGNDSLINPNAAITRQNAIAMIARLYELKTGESAQPSISNQLTYSDIKLVDSSLLPKVLFAIENGLVVGRDGSTLAPQETVTRGELMGMLEKLLAITGEVD